MGEPAIGQVVDGRYELEALIGRGGMGSVYRARHVVTNGRVAIKLVTDTLDRDAERRFLAEARAAATIGHPAIVAVSDANRSPEGQLYLVMELLAGKSLRFAGPLPGEQVQRVGLEMLDALAAAHARGVVHRDLKPDNIFLVAPTGAVKILDFGIAKTLESSATSHGMVLGTVEYMAPEQLDDAARVDGRADLWAVAVILYERIAGVRPFTGATRDELFRALASDEPTPIERVVPVAANVSGFFATALARDPALRFQTAQAMAGALRQLALSTGTTAAGGGGGPTLGTGNTPDSGPTLGTGLPRVPSSPPETPHHGSGPTLATGHSPAPGGPPPSPAPWQPMPSPAPAPARPKPKTRVITIAIAGIAVAGIAIGIGVAASKSDDKPPANAEPTPSVASQEPVAVARASEPSIAKTAKDDGEDVSIACKRHCTAVAGCKLDLPGCVADCKTNGNHRRCLAKATDDCDALAACHWEKYCDRPVRAYGTLSCSEGVGCFAGHKTSSAVQCTSCLDLMTTAALTVFAKFEICRDQVVHVAMERSGSQVGNYYTTHCHPLWLACTTTK